MSVTSEHAGCTLLVVDADPARLARTVTVLSQAGYACASATSVTDARAATADRPPDLLITDVRVGAGLGVDLVLQRYLSDRRSVMVDTQFRQELAVDASRLDALYLMHPVKPQRLLQAVTDQLRQQRGDERRRWPRAALRSGVQIAVDGTQATLTDVSYGGFRIAIAAGATDRGPPCVTIRLAPLTQTVRGRLAWQTATGGVSRAASPWGTRNRPHRPSGGNGSTKSLCSVPLPGVSSRSPPPGQASSSVWCVRDGVSVVGA